MIAQLKQLVQPATAGDSMGGQLWTYHSLSRLAAFLLFYSIKVSPTTGGKMLRPRGYALRVNRMSLSRATPAGRDGRFSTVATLGEYTLPSAFPSKVWIPRRTR